MPSLVQIGSLHCCSCPLFVSPNELPAVWAAVYSAWVWNPQEILVQCHPGRVERNVPFRSSTHTANFTPLALGWTKPFGQGHNGVSDAVGHSSLIDPFSARTAQWHPGRFQQNVDLRAVLFEHTQWKCHATCTQMGDKAFRQEVKKSGTQRWVTQPEIALWWTLCFLTQNNRASEIRHAPAAHSWCKFKSQVRLLSRCP